MPEVHGVFRAILQGVHTRGDGGVLFVKGDGCAYRFPHEFTDAGFRGSLEGILEEDEGAHFFVVEERDGQLHVLAYPRAHVADQLFGGGAEGSGGGGAAAPGADAAGA